MEMNLDQLIPGRRYRMRDGKEFFFVGFMSDGFGVAEWDADTVCPIGEECQPFRHADKLLNSGGLSDIQDAVNSIFRRLEKLEAAR